MPARHSYSTTSNGVVNDFARKVYTREELLSIRFQSHWWSNNFLYYCLKSLWIFKYRGRRSGYSSKRSIRTNKQAIPAICSRRCKEDIIFNKRLVLLDWPGSLAGQEAFTIERQTTVSKIITAKPATFSQFVPSLFLSNVASLAPKIDEVNNVVTNANFDVVCITEHGYKVIFPTL